MTETNNEFLQRVYDANPGGWMPQGWKPVAKEWADTPNPSWHCSVDWRLRPILPDNLPEPPEESYLYGPERGGFYLRGTIRTTNGFRGWSHSGIRGWEYGLSWAGFGCHYILDLSDPNARAILEDNELWPGEGESSIDHVLNGALRESGTPCQASVHALVTLDDPNLREALIANGWTPPDQQRDEWVTLDECDIEVRIEGSTEEWAECDFCDDDAHAFHLIETLCTGGSRAVRIRRKRGDA